MMCNRLMCLVVGVAVLMGIMPIVMYECEYNGEANIGSNTGGSSSITNYTNLIAMLETYDNCEKVFDVQMLSFCYDVPSYIYEANPEFYDKTITFYNYIKGINYSEIGYCLFDFDGVLIPLNLKKLKQDSPYLWKYSRVYV